MRLPCPRGTRVVAVTRDPGLVAALRADDEVTLVAHVEEPAVALVIATGGSVGAVVADENAAAELTRLWGARRGASPGGGELPPLYVLRPTPGYSLVPEVCDAGVVEAAAHAASGAGEPRSLRDWWLASQGLPAEGGERTGTLRQDPSLPRPGSAPAAPVPEVLMRQAIVVVSPKGGVGKTFLSVNLAAALARHTGFRTVLVDLDLGSGDAAVQLDLIGRPTLADLVPYVSCLEPTHLDRVVATHPGSRLDILLAPAKPEAAELVGREHVGALLRLVKQRYDFVVVDTPPNPADPIVPEALAEATAVVLVSTLDAGALRRCRLFLEAAGRGDARLVSRLVLVLNQVREGGCLGSDRAAAFVLGAAKARTVVVPDDRGAVEKAVFEGTPLVISEPAHPVSRAVFGLANQFCPVFGGLVGDGRGRRWHLGRIVETLRRW
ncbi:MAG: AAA family ATPase [Firmicutes bacterium]|nr:AAA family ATPase [Bacillota bacterium]